jgi:hypothetical protein
VNLLKSSYPIASLQGYKAYEVIWGAYQAANLVEFNE